MQFKDAVVVRTVFEAQTEEGTNVFVVKNGSVPTPGFLLATTHFIRL